MNVRKKKLLFITVLSIIIFLITTNVFKNNKTIYHTSTMNIKVIDKYMTEEDITQYFLKGKNINDPFQQIIIEVKDENIWNLIDINNYYFVNVSWETNTPDSNIQNKSTILLQIDKL